MVMSLPMSNLWQDFSSLNICVGSGALRAVIVKVFQSFTEEFYFFNKHLKIKYCDVCSFLLAYQTYVSKVVSVCF